MNGFAIISGYEKILSVSGQMLIAAEQLDWDRYLQLQAQFNLELSKLPTQSLATNLNADQQQTVSELIQSIQLQFDKVHQCVDESLSDLTAKIENTHTQKKLELAYKSL